MRLGGFCFTFALALSPAIGTGAPPRHCLDLPAASSRPPDCDDPASPSYNPNGTWCACLKSGLATTAAGDSLTIEQTILSASHEPTVGIYHFSAAAGTLDLSAIRPGDDLGQITADIPKELLGTPEDFILDFHLIAASAAGGELRFDVRLRPANPTTISILGHDPTDASHSAGLTYVGSVTANGPGAGFTLEFSYLGAELLPPGVDSFGIEEGDLIRPGLNLPFLLRFPAPGLYRLPREATLRVETLIARYGDDYGIDPYHPSLASLDPSFTRSFIEDLDLVPPAVPTGLAAAGGDGRSSLDWSDNTETDLEGYAVLRGETAGGPYAPLATTSASEYVDTGLQNDRTYFYVITAVDRSSNESGRSIEAWATPEALLRQQHVRGDANDDAKVDVSDAVTNLNFQFLGGLALSCVAGLDFDANSRLEVTDPILILNVLFLGDPNRPPLFQRCESFEAAAESADCPMPAGYACPAAR